MNRMVRLISRALEPGEREVVLGDLSECGSSWMRSVFDLAGLVVRRQVMIWTQWRPWLGVVGIAGVSGFCLNRLLSRLRIGIYEQMTAWRHYGVHYNTGVTSFREDVIQMICLAAAIFCWTAVNASVLRILSGRAGWLTGLIFYYMVFDLWRGVAPWWTALPWVLPLAEILVLRGPGGRWAGMAAATVVCTAAVLGVRHSHDLERFSNGVFPAASWWVIVGPYLLVSWPVLVGWGLRRR